MVVWDWGEWEAAGTDDPNRALAEGELHFDLHGKKLEGRFVLVRRGQCSGRSGKEQWLLIHKRDDFAEEGWDPEDHPQSVKSGRTNDEVTAAPDDAWSRDRPTVGPWARREGWAGASPEELAALDDLDREGAWEVDGREVRTTNLDKVLFPEGNGQPACQPEALPRRCRGQGLLAQGPARRRARLRGGVEAPRGGRRPRATTS